MYPSKSIWSYLRQSKGRHNVHSPFIFDFVDSCLTTKMDKNFRKSLKKWYKSILKDNTTLRITDLGAGSKRLNNLRKPKDLLRTSSSKGIYGRVLYQLAAHYKPSVSLELGTSIGVGSIHLKSGYPKGHLITVEGCSDTLRFAEKQYSQWGFDHLTSIEEPFDDFLSKGSAFTYDLVYIDGNHSGEATKRYLQLLKNQTHDNTLFILDDIRWNDDMWQCWNDLIQSTDYHVSIDLGRMGILVRRPEQTKEHFTVRPFILKTKLL